MRTWWPRRLSLNCLTLLLSPVHGSGGEPNPISLFEKPHNFINTRPSYTGSSVVANVAYDAFTSSSTGGSAEYEVMIWLAALGGAGPISQTGSPVATPSIAGVSWKLYSGFNGQMHVFSFVASSQVTSFSGDLKAFFTYLISSQGMPSSQYLQNIGAGTETFTGSNAVFSTSAYSLTAK